MQYLLPIVIGGLLGALLSYIYVFYVQGNERRIMIVSLGFTLGGLVGAGIAWWLSS